MSKPSYRFGSETEIDSYPGVCGLMALVIFLPASSGCWPRSWAQAGEAASEAYGAAPAGVAVVLSDEPQAVSRTAAATVEASVANTGRSCLMRMAWSSFRRRGRDSPLVGPS